MKLNKLLSATGNYVLDKKLAFDAVFEPISSAIIANLTAVKAWDVLETTINATTMPFKTLLMNMGTAGLLWGLYKGNEALSPYVLGTGEDLVKRYGNGERGNLASFGRTAIATAAITTLFTTLNVGKSIDNIDNYALRVFNAINTQISQTEIIQENPNVTQETTRHSLDRESDLESIVQTEQSSRARHKDNTSQIRIEAKYKFAKSNANEMEIIIPESLRGKKFGHLLAMYLGEFQLDENGYCRTVEFGDTYKVDFKKTLDKLWRIKASRSKGNKEINIVRQNQVAQYNPQTATRMTLDEYIMEADQVAEQTFENIDWDKIKHVFMFKKDDGRLDLLQKLAKSIDGITLISYALTELMPTKDGTLNMNMLDFLLQTAGREYVELLPAIADGETSFGPYQFTKYSVLDSDGNRNGASRINIAVGDDELRIPNHTYLLEGREHHSAAYLNAVNNFAMLVRTLNDEQIRTLEKNLEQSRDDLAAFMATAHNKSRNAIQSAQRWLDNNCEQNYRVSCDNSIITYGKKSQINYDALEWFIDVPFTFQDALVSLD